MSIRKDLINLINGDELSWILHDPELDKYPEVKRELQEAVSHMNKAIDLLPEEIDNGEI